MKKYFFLLSTLILVSIQSILAQTPCKDGFAGEYPCNDYDLMARIPVSILANTNGNPEGSDLWGWTDSTTGKEYAIVAMTNSTAFVDVTDPVNPIFLGRLDSNAGNNFWRDVKIYKDFAFIVADNVGAHGMQVFDLKKLRNITSPQTFSSDTVFNGVSSCHNIFINEDSGIAYLVGCNNFNGGPNFVDISNPLNPVGLGGYSTEGYSHDVQVVNYKGPDSRYTNKEIYVGSNGRGGGGDKIVILDVTDKNNVIKIADLTYQQAGYTHQGWFTEDQRYFILGDELDERDFGFNSRSLVFDLLDLTNPKLSSTYFGTTPAIDHNGYVKGDKYYMANYRAGMRVLDLTNIAAATNSMTEVGFFDTFPANSSYGFNGAWSLYPFFESGNIIINDIERGLFIVRKSGTLSTENFDLEKGFSVFPNPIKNGKSLTLKSSETIHKIAVFNTLGQQILSKKGNQQKEDNLVLNHFSSGIYFIKINDLKLQKVIVNK